MKAFYYVSNEEEFNHLQEYLLNKGCVWKGSGKTPILYNKKYPYISVDLGHISISQNPLGELSEIPGLNKGHPHAESMRLFAEDALTHPEPWKLWEMKLHFWVDCHENPTWVPIAEYRRKSIKNIETLEKENAELLEVIKRIIKVTKDLYKTFPTNVHHYAAEDLIKELEGKS